MVHLSWSSVVLGVIEGVSKLNLQCQVCEKNIAMGKYVYYAFMDLEKVYDTVD